MSLLNGARPQRPAAESVCPNPTTRRPPSDAMAGHAASEWIFGDQVLKPWHRGSASEEVYPEPTYLGRDVCSLAWLSHDELLAIYTAVGESPAPG